jgi:hypothetical protein
LKIKADQEEADESHVAINVNGTAIITKSVMKVGGGSDSKKEIGSGVTGEITNDSMYCCRNKSKLR